MVEAGENQTESRYVSKVGLTGFTMGAGHGGRRGKERAQERIGSHQIRVGHMMPFASLWGEKQRFHLDVRLEMTVRNLRGAVWKKPEGETRAYSRKQKLGCHWHVASG